MSIWSSPEREQLRKTVRRFVEREVLPSVEQWERRGELPWLFHGYVVKYAVVGESEYAEETP